MDVVEVVAGVVLVAVVLMAGVAAVFGQGRSVRVLAVAGVLLLALLAVHRGDPELLSGVGGLVRP